MALGVVCRVHCWAARIPRTTLTLKGQHTCRRLRGAPNGSASCREARKLGGNMATAASVPPAQAAAAAADRRDVWCPSSSTCSLCPRVPLQLAPAPAVQWQPDRRGGCRHRRQYSGQAGTGHGRHNTASQGRRERCGRQCDGSSGAAAWWQPHQWGCGRGRVQTWGGARRRPDSGRL
jgi:hypothetical protein